MQIKLVQPLPPPVFTHDNSISLQLIKKSKCPLKNQLLLKQFAIIGIILEKIIVFVTFGVEFNFT